MTRIANYASQQILNSYLQNLQSRIQDTQVQLTSGQRSTTYAGLGGDTQRLVSYEVDVMKLTNYIKVNENKDVALESTGLMLEGVQTSITEMKRVLTLNHNQQPTTEAGIRSIQETAFRELRNVEGYLNTVVNGQYLFSGNKTNTKPVDFGLTTLDAFQDKYDGVNLSYPESREAHLENYNLKADGTGQTNWLTFTQDADGDTTTKGVGRITATTNQFANVSVGSSVEITGTANNNGTYWVEAISADGKSIDVRTKMMTNEYNTTSAVLTKTGGASISSTGYGDLTFDRAAASIVATTTGSLSGITVGSTFKVTGSTQNNGTYIVESNDGTTLKIVEKKLVDEGTVASDIINLTAQSFNFTVNAGNDTIDSGVANTFSKLSAGMEIAFGGTNNNNATYTVASVAIDGKSITVTETVTAETAVGSTGTALVVKPATNTLDLTDQNFIFTANTNSNDTIDSSVANTFSALSSGMKVTIAGTTNNNGTFTVASVSADGSSISVIETLTTETQVSIAQISNVAWSNDPTTTQVNHIDISGTIDVGDVFSMTVNGTTYNHTVLTNAATAGDVATGLRAAINADAGAVVTATGATGQVILTADVSGTAFTTALGSTNATADNTQAMGAYLETQAAGVGQPAIGTVTLSGVVEAGDVFSIDLDAADGNGVTTYTFTAVAGGESLAAVATGLAAEIQANSGFVTAVGAGAVITITNAANNLTTVATNETATNRTTDATQVIADTAITANSAGYEVGDVMTMVINGNTYSHTLTSSVSNIGAATAFLTANKVAIEAAENVTIADNGPADGTLVVTADAIGGTFTITATQTTNTFDVEAAPTITTQKDGNDTAVIAQADGTLKSVFYYNGDTFSQRHRASDNRDITINLNAIDPAFEKTFRALAILAQGKYNTSGGLDQAENSGRIDDARNLLSLAENYNNTTNPKYEEGFTSSMQEITLTLGYQRSTLKNLNTDHTNLIGFFEARSASLEGIDQLSVITGLLNDQQALEASYQAMSRIRSLALHDYL